MKPTEPSVEYESRTARLTRICVARFSAIQSRNFLARLAVALIASSMILASQVPPTNASTGASSFSPFEQVTISQQNGYCLNQQFFFENATFENQRCLLVGEYYGQLVGLLGASESGANLEAISAYYIVSDTRIWSGCCLPGDYVYVDISLYGRLDYAGGGNAAIIVRILPHGRTTCFYEHTDCHTWSWFASVPLYARNPNEERTIFGRGSLSVTGNIGTSGPSFPYKRLYWQPTVSGPFDVLVYVGAEGTAEGHGGVADFYTGDYYTAILDYGWIRPSSPASPTINPVIGLPNGAARGSTGPAICWNEVNDIAVIAEYTVQIATNTGFTSIAASTTIGDGGSAVFCYSPTLSQGQYYWRVRDKDLLGQTSAWSTTWSFIVDTSPPPPPTLVSPANNALTNDNTPTLSWNSVTDTGSPASGTLGYQPQLDTTSAFNSPNLIFDPNSVRTVTNFTPASALADGTWYWRVRTVDNARNLGGWSGTWSFNLDATTPSSSVSPLPGYSKPPFLVSWSGVGGVASYDIQYRDATANGPWTNWLVGTTLTSATFCSPCPTSDPIDGRAYEFRSQAKDAAGNVEPYPAGADTRTRLDTEGPVTTFASPGAGSWQTSSFAVTATQWDGMHLWWNSGGAANAYVYLKFSSTSYTIASGDKLVYDVYIDQSSPTFQCGLDGRVGGVTIRDNTVGWTDQNGLGVHPSTSLSGYANGNWYSRTFDISNKAGQSITEWAFACEGDAAGLYKARLGRVIVTDSAGVVKTTIYADGNTIIEDTVWSGAGVSPSSSRYSLSGQTGRSACYYRVLSNGVETLPWTSFTCSTGPTVTVGTSMNCRDDGANKCEVYLYATDLMGNAGSIASRTFSVNITPPTTSFTFTPSSPVVGQTVTFTGTASGGTAPYSFQWNFGDGSSAVGPSASHVYSVTGIYTATLTTTDADGRQATYSSTVRVGDFGLSRPSSSPVWVAQGSSGAALINVQSFNGFSGNVNIFATGLPAGASCSFDRTLVTLTAGATEPVTCTISASSNMALGTYSFTVTGTSGNLARSLTVSFRVLPSPFSFSQTLTFYGVSATLTGTFSDDTMSRTLSGTAYLTASNSTSGVIIASNKPVSISVTYDSNGRALFIVVMDASPFWLSMNCQADAVAGTVSCTSLTRTLDINHDGYINIIDSATVGAAYGSTPASSNWNPQADLNADGIVNIIDMALIGYFYYARVFLP